MSTSIKTTSRALAASIDGAQITGQQWTVAAAYRFCERLARSHYENFPVGSVLVPKPLRQHFYSIYAFARTADDFADEGYDEQHSPQARLALLTCRNGTWMPARVRLCITPMTAASPKAATATAKW